MQTKVVSKEICVDIHNNGATLPARGEFAAKPIAFSDPALTLDDIREVLEHIKKGGTTLILPTIMTTARDVVIRNCALIAEAMEQPWGAAIGGIHLEGPFINLETKGAHPAQHVEEQVDFGFIGKVFESAKGRIALITLSPALSNVLPFIEAICELGVEVSLGHHTANSTQIKEAINAGARGITHLGNAGLKPLAGKGEVLIASLASGTDTYVMLIPDGTHITNDYIFDASTIVESLRPGHTIWVSDSSPLATAPEGTEWQYDGRISTVIRDDITGALRPNPLSGSYLLLPQCLAWLRKEKLVSEELVVAGSSQNPLNFLRIPLERIKGSL
jgi:N-acetylglucosamine-6-phosphate deacetylase